MLSTILIIDDALDVHTLLAARLKPEGLNLVSATSWNEGLELAVSVRPDLILLDVDMPGQSGLDVCRMLKSDPRTENIPVIFLSGSTDVQTKVHGFDLGAVDFVNKPFQPAELRARVRSALRTKRYQDLLAERAQVDALTGLRNRRFFDELLGRSVSEAHVTGRPCALILADLDHFKAFNDAFGHPFGDAVLQRTGELISAALPPGVSACRYGGEEIGIVLPNTSSAAAVVLAEHLRAQLTSIDLSPKGERIVIRASFGVADTNEASRMGMVKAANGLLTAADAALYRAKREGRDRVCCAFEQSAFSTRPSLLAPVRFGTRPSELAQRRSVRMNPYERPRTSAPPVPVSSLRPKLTG